MRKNIPHQFIISIQIIFLQIGILSILSHNKVSAQEKKYDPEDIQSSDNISNEDPHHDYRPLVLVTGISGYLGSHCAKILVEKGYRVRGTVRNINNKKHFSHITDLSDQIQIVECDLTKDKNWDKAFKDVDYVLHTASPFPSNTNPPNKDILLKPAIEGTERIMNYCINSPTVRRIVLTSSTVSVSYSKKPIGYIYSSKDFSDDHDKQNTYALSKVRAEKQAWKMINEAADKGLKKLEMVVINPTFMVGPSISMNNCTSLKIISQILNRKYPKCIKYNFCMVDVRDVALAHIRSIEVDEAAGQRLILVNGSLWMNEVGSILKKNFNKYGYNPPTKTFPNWFVRLIGIFNKDIRGIVRLLGHRKVYDSSHGPKILGFQYRDLEDSLVDMGHCIIQNNIIPMTEEYKKVFAK